MAVRTFRRLDNLHLYYYSATMVSDWWKVDIGQRITEFLGEDYSADPFVVTGFNVKDDEIWIARRGVVNRCSAEELNMRWMTENEEKAERPANR